MLTQAEIRELFCLKKREERAGKICTFSSDVLNTRDFSFSPICPGNYVGDSGPLLFAQHEAKSDCQLLIKHTRLHTAANEYVYSKLARAMGYAVPAAVLFQVSPDDHDIFETDFVVGSTFFQNAKTKPTFDQIREQAENWQDYFHLRALFRMFLDDDGFEALLTSERRIYRIDTADSFGVNEFVVLAAADIRYLRFATQQHFMEHHLLRDLFDLWDYTFFDESLEACSKLDITGRAHYMEPFDRIQSIPQAYIDDILDCLCRFYPDLLCEYYKRFISTIQAVSKAYLKVKG